MRTRIIAFLQPVLIFPAALFMASLVVRHLGPLQYEPAHAAQQIVVWYAGRVWTLRVLLFALPCLVFFSGCIALRSWIRDSEHLSTQRSLASSRPRWPVRLVSVTTVSSAGILAIVGFHVLTH
ncbi:MAG TPA: hypothetical protein VIY68_15470 [Steroidobacteraceae bacterium]